MITQRPTKEQLSCYNKTRRKITGGFAQGKITEEDAIQQMLIIGALHPRWLTDRPNRMKDPGGYQQWMSSLSESIIRFNFSPTGKYGRDRAQFINIRKAVAARGGRSVTGAFIDDKRPSFHHLDHTTKTMEPTAALRISPSHPELDLCVLLTHSEHMSYHNACKREFGQRVPPAGIDPVKHFWNWVESYKKKNGLS